MPPPPTPPAGPAATATDDLRTWRTQVLDAVLRGLCWLGAPTALAAAVATLNDPAAPDDRAPLLVAIGFAVAYGLLLLLTFPGRRLPLAGRAVALLALVAALGLATLVQFGLSGPGPLVS